MGRMLPEPLPQADMWSLLPVVCDLGPSGSWSLLCMSGPFHRLLSLACDQGAMRVPSGGQSPGLSKAWGGRVHSSFLLGVPFLPLSSPVVTWWPFGLFAAVASPRPSCPSDGSPLGAPNRVQRDLSCAGVTGSLPCALQSRKLHESLNLLVLVWVCAGWSLEKNGRGRFKGKEM